MTTSTFVKSIVDQIDETMRQIDDTAEHILGLTARARNLAALAKRYVAEGEADQRADKRAIEAAQRLDQEIETEMQRAIERGEQKIDKQIERINEIWSKTAEDLLAATGHLLTKEQANRLETWMGKPITDREELMARKQEADALGANLTPREASGPLGSALSVLTAGIAGALQATDDLHTAYDAAAPFPLGDPSSRVVVGIDIGSEERAGFFVRDMAAHERGEERWIDAGQIPAEAFSGGISTALGKAYESIEGAERLTDIEFSHQSLPVGDAASFIEIVNLPPSPGGDETEAADVAPQPQEAASVDEKHPDLVWMTMTQEGTDQTSADQAAPVDLIPAGPRDPNTRPTHPGIFLRDDILPFSIETITSVAQKLGMPARTLEQILNGYAGFSLNECRILGEIFRNGSAVWVQMRQAYDNWVPPASAEEAAEPEAGQEEASTTADDRGEAEPAAEPPPPAPVEPPLRPCTDEEKFGESGDFIAPQIGRQSDAPKPRALDHLYEEVLTLWSTTEKTEAQIARATASTISLVRTYLEQARADGDERIEARQKGRLKERRTVKPAAAPKEEEPMPPVTGNSAEPRRQPFTKSRDIEIGEFKPEPGTEKDKISTGICVVDFSRNKIIGNKGMWTATPEICKVVAFLNDGQCYAAGYIATQAGWDPQTLIQHRTSIMERLRDIGVQLTDIPGIGWHLKRS